MIPTLLRKIIFIGLISFSAEGLATAAPVLPGEEIRSEADIQAAAERVLITMDEQISALPRKLEYRRREDLGEFDFFSLSITGFKELALSVDGRAARAREDGITKDGLILLLCHELGHLAGGNPRRHFALRDIPMSAEGQADFFATAACFPHVVRTDDNSDFLKFLRADPAIRALCDHGADDQERARCVRTALASQSVARSLHRTWDPKFAGREAGPVPALGRQSATAALFLNTEYSDPQCRLDTMVAGLRCQTEEPASFFTSPKFNTRCGPADQAPRPSCWFKTR